MQMIAAVLLLYHMSQLSQNFSKVSSVMNLPSKWLALLRSNSQKSAINLFYWVSWIPSWLLRNSALLLSNSQKWSIMWAREWIYEEQRFADIISQKSALESFCNVIYLMIMLNLPMPMSRHLTKNYIADFYIRIWLQRCCYHFTWVNRQRISQKSAR